MTSYSKDQYKVNQFTKTIVDQTKIKYFQNRLIALLIELIKQKLNEKNQHPVSLLEFYDSTIRFLQQSMYKTTNIRLFSSLLDKVSPQASYVKTEKERNYLEIREDYLKTTNGSFHFSFFLPREVFQAQ